MPDDKIKPARKDYFELVLDKVIGVGGILAVLTVSAATILREISISLSWSDEFVRALFIWLFFIGGALTYKHLDVISINILEEYLKSKNMKYYYALNLVQVVAMTRLFASVTYYATYTMLSEFRLGQKTQIMNIQTGFITMGCSVGCGMLGVYGGIHIYRFIKKLFKG